MEARQGQETPKFETVLMENTPPEDQNKILKSLEPKGDLRITITNDVGRPNGVEKVSHLAIYNPW